jgi:hypothetical protein
VTKLKQVGSLMVDTLACERDRRSMPAHRRRRAQRADRHDNPQPNVGAARVMSRSETAKRRASRTVVSTERKAPPILR